MGRRAGILVVLAFMVAALFTWDAWQAARWPPPPSPERTVEVRQLTSDPGCDPRRQSCNALDGELVLSVSARVAGAGTGLRVRVSASGDAAARLERLAAAVHPAADDAAPTSRVLDPRPGRAWLGELALARTGADAGARLEVEADAGDQRWRARFRLE